MQKLDLTHLNSKQLEAVNATDGAVLVTAGAGSGKTRVLTHRIAHLIEDKKVNPFNILAITFTNKAAQEMRERLQSLLQDFNANNMWITTFHSMCVKILRQNRNIEHFEGYSTNFSIYDQTDRERMLKIIIAEKKIVFEDFLAKVNWHLSNRKNKNLTLDEYANSISFSHDVDIIIDVITEYEKRMNKNNALDFDSLLTYTYRLFKENKEVLEHYRDKFEYVHIDEFQDTNSVQYDLAVMLSGKYKNIFVVGDEDQCIYTWRGANSTHIFKFTTDFENVKTIKLEQNYRSTKKIIELANKVIKNNTSRLDKELWTDKESGVRIEHSSPWNGRYEADYVAEHIYNLVNRNGYKYSDIAVLMRLNALTRNFEDKLLDFNIPYRVFGGMKFYDRAEIKNVLAYLKLIINPKDTSSFTRIINFPKRGIGKVALLNLKESMGALDSPLEAVLRLNEESKVSRGALTKFLNFKAIFNNLVEKSRSLPLPEFVQYLIDFVGIEKAYISGKEEDINRIYNISEFAKAVSEYKNVNKEADLSEYLQSVSLVADIDGYDENENAVTLATVHGVKGLEFKVVFIVAAEERIFPLKRKDSTDKDMEEERRLMYVAITRAEERLYITNAKQRFLYGETKIMQPSIFLREAGLIDDTKIDSLNSASGYKNREDKEDSTISASEKAIKTKDLVEKIKVNDRVDHPRFGAGVVVSLSGKGTTKTAKINFEGYGSKFLALNFAPLTII